MIPCSRQNGTDITTCGSNWLAGMVSFKCPSAFCMETSGRLSCLKDSQGLQDFVNLSWLKLIKLLIRQAMIKMKRFMLNGWKGDGGGFWKGQVNKYTKILLPPIARSFPFLERRINLPSVVFLSFQWKRNKPDIFQQWFGQKHSTISGEIEQASEVSFWKMNEIKCT